MGAPYLDDAVRILFLSYSCIAQFLYSWDEPAIDLFNSGDMHGGREVSLEDWAFVDIIVGMHRGLTAHDPAESSMARLDITSLAFMFSGC